MRKKRPVLFAAFGIGCAVLFAGILAAVIHFVIQPAMSRETWGRTVYRGETVELWYADESPQAASHEDLEALLETDVSGLLERLGLGRADIPFPLEVFVHDDVGQLMKSIATRASVDISPLRAPLDVLTSEDARPRLAELILSHGWGRCGSQAFYRGMLLYAAFPERDFHMYVAALPERMRHSIPDLIMLEASGKFDLTFYQKHTSPFANRFLLTLEAFGAFLDIPRVIADAPEVDILSLETASLAKYLVEVASDMDAVREAWAAGFLDTILKRVSLVGLTELNAAWQETAVARGQEGEGFELNRAHFLLEGGEFDEAYAVTSGRALDTSDPNWLDVRVRSAILAGELESAVRLATASDPSSLAPDLQEWLAVVSAMNVVSTENVRIIGDQSSSELHALVEELDDTYGALERSLDRTLSNAALPITVFLYRDSEAREIGMAATKPDFHPRASLHLVASDELHRELIGFVLSAAWHPSRSPVMTCGLVNALLRNRGDLVSEACDLRRADRWVPLDRIFFLDADSHVLQIELALLLQLVLEDLGVEAVRSMWEMTTALGGAMTFATAMEQVLGFSLSGAESEFLDDAVPCGSSGDL